MSRWRASFAERTFDKWMLCLAGTGALAVAALYLFGGPNRVKYAGALAGPRKLDALILADARALQRRVQAARPTSFRVPEYARQMKALQEWSAAERLERSAAFGRSIPLIAGVLEAAATVSLITPLAPDQPVARFGAFGLASADADPNRKDSDESPTEFLNWFTIAAYLDPSLQREAMVEAGYAPHRQQALVVGVDVQRQDFASAGQSGEWHDVAPADGLFVEFDLPRPIFDDETGRCLNRLAVAAALARVKAAQADVMQPLFVESAVAAGAWRMPALDGYRQREEAVVKHLESDLKEVRRLIRRKEFDAARRLAQGTHDHALATPGIVRDAKRLLQIIERRTPESGSRKPPDGSHGPGGDVPISPSGNRPARIIPRGGDKPQDPPAQFIVEPGAFVRHPDDRRPAVWFHDTSVEPGGRYRYRLRVRLWNRYAGLRRPLIDPAGAGQVELIGRWSPPSEIVEAPLAPRERG